MVSQKSGLVPHQLETKNSDAPETKTATAETPTGGAAAGGLALLPVFWRLPVGHTTSAINEREHPRELTCILIGRSILAGFTCRTTPQVCYINPELCTTSTMRTLRDHKNPPKESWNHVKRGDNFVQDSPNRQDGI